MDTYRCIRQFVTILSLNKTRDFIEQNDSARCLCQRIFVFVLRKHSARSFPQTMRDWLGTEGRAFFHWKLFCGQWWDTERYTFSLGFFLQIMFGNGGDGIKSNTEKNRQNDILSMDTDPAAFDRLTRYSIIHDKNPREIVLLRGRGCAWRRCRFCDYHLDFSRDAPANFRINQATLAKVRGLYGTLEVCCLGFRGRRLAVWSRILRRDSLSLASLSSRFPASLGHSPNIFFRNTHPIHELTS